jgi:peptidoglycan-N-acetylglucosamine deacetylase
MNQNIMSVDLEDYFCDLPVNEWSKYKSRILQTTDTLLNLFEETNTKATFFVVGYFAEKFPELIKKIHDQGHEIGSHTFSHIDLRKYNKLEIELDLKKSISVLESLTGEKVLGFRAPFFSINESNAWVIDILKKYFIYDSSIFPVKTPLYGLPSAPRNIYHPSEYDITKEDQQEKFIEIPPLTLKILNYNLPVAGGFYFRFFPNFLIKQGIKKFNKNNSPAMFYIHPKDLDEKMPKIDSYSWHYYYGKNNVKEKFSDLLQCFKFNSAKEVLNL